MIPEGCCCEYVDVGVGLQLIEPAYGCVVHDEDMLAAMTQRRHESERELGIEPVKQHWAHAGCQCGCEWRSAE